MFSMTRVIGSVLLVYVLAGTALAQEKRSPVETPQEPVAPAPAAPLVTAAATAKRVRFVSPGTVVQLRLEVYNEAGQKQFDTELHGGNVLDWQLQDGAGERLPAGSYACVLTIKSLSGRLSQRIGLVTVNDKKAAVEVAGGAQLSGAQQQVIGPMEDNAAFTVLPQSDAEAVTALTHDGADGQIGRTRGALSFRSGDFFSGKDAEQMRLTEEGNLGIGTDKPQAKLDVSGVIRTSKGIEFANGTEGEGEVTTLTTTATGALQQTLADGTVVPNATGTGTQDRIAKWTDGAGTLGDSLLRESSGRIEVLASAAGSGVTPSILNPNNVPGFAQFQFYPATGPNSNMSFTVVPRGTGAANNRAQFSIFGTDLFADATNYEFASLRARGTDFVFGTGKSGSGQTRPMMLAAGFLNDNITNNGQLYLAADGNVGVGNTNPLAKLDVAGDTKVSSNLTVDTNTLFVNAANDRVGIGTTAPTAVLNVIGSQPPAVAGAGFGPDATPVLRVIGGKGGNNFVGGSGGLVLIQAGDGGNASGGTGDPTGNGGSITLQPGSKGSGGSGALSPPGANGNIFLAPAVGNVGIGTTNVSAKLHVVGDTKLSNNLAVGTNSLFVDATNNKVGIGTTAPARMLHLSGVGGDNAGQTDLRITGIGGAGSGATLEALGGGGRTYSILSTADAAGGAGTGGGRLAVLDVTETVYRMVIDSSGNMGIGTFNPTAKLHVAGGDAAISTQGNGLILRAFDGPKCFRVTVNNLGALNVAEVSPCP